MAFFLDGALSMGYVVACLFFLRFWKETRDRLFGCFSASFCLLALSRTALAITGQESEVSSFIYLVRLAAYLLIVAAIVDKNLAKSPSP